MYKIELTLHSEEFAALAMQAYIAKRKIEDQVIQILKQGLSSGWNPPSIEVKESGVKAPDGRVLKISLLEPEDLPEIFQAYAEYIQPEGGSNEPMVLAEFVEPNELSEEIQSYAKDTWSAKKARESGSNS